MASKYMKNGLKRYSKKKVLIKSFLLITCLILIYPSLVKGNEWPWTFWGGNFKISNNIFDDVTPSIASNSNLYLVVWARKSPWGFDIYGARVTPDGKLMEGDEEGIPISTANNNQMFPSVTWNGDSFFVVWQDFRNGKAWSIYGARVTPEGGVLDPEGIPIYIARQNYDQVAPVVSFDGENYLVVWQGKRTPKIWNIYFSRVSKEGVVLNQKPIPINSSLQDQISPFIIFDGENYFVVWQDKRSRKLWDIYGARINSKGEVLDKQAIRITSSGESGWDHWRPILSWSGKTYLVLWMISFEPNRWHLYGKRVGAYGGVLDVAPLPIQRDSTNKAFPAITWDGSEYFLIWEEEPEGNSKILGAPLRMEYGDPHSVGDSILISELEGVASEVSQPAISKLMGENSLLIVFQAKTSEGFWQIFGQALFKMEENGD